MEQVKTTTVKDRSKSREHSDKVTVVVPQFS